MKLKDIEIIVMNDEEYGDHLNKLFEKVKEGKINESEPHKIVSRTTEDIGKIGADKIKDSIKLEFDSFNKSGDDMLITAYPAKNTGGVKCLPG